MKIEILFPEAANLFGDSWNYRYLKECMPEAEFFETKLTDEPAFVSQDIDMIYMGAMTERAQEWVIDRLMPHKERLRELIDTGKVLLMTANAGEVFYEYIENEDGSRVKALGLVPFYAKRDMMHRHSATILCDFDGMKLVGFKAEFSQTFGEAKYELAKMLYGTGRSKTDKLEGVRVNNFISTSIVGPFLMMNPQFVKYIMTLLGIDEPTLKYENEITAAYESRLADIERMMNNKK